MLVLLLLVSCLLWTVTRPQFNLYNTDESLDSGHFEVNCLHYYNSFERDITEKIDYCLGSTAENNASVDELLDVSDRHFTFAKLRQLNVATKELLSWSATIDLAERYQYYIEQQGNPSASREVFVNCTKPWFGPRCQYSFGLGKTYLFQNIVEKALRKKFRYLAPYSISNLTCYMHLTCDRGGSELCLDWREVCDGRIDCFNGADEVQCFDLEVNECNENEYRCHNGLCIPKDFLDDNTPQCLDKSDIVDTFYLGSNAFPYVFYHEEHSCRAGHEQFSCGDGQCVADFSACLSQRHLLLNKSIATQGNLFDACWMVMSCLTKILDRVNGTSCEQFLRSTNISAYLQTCEPLIQFPTVPVLFGHVTFLYRSTDARALDMDLSLMPDYVCYDQQLCDFLTPTFLEGNYSCRRGHEIGFDSSVQPKNWSSIILLIEPYFRRCLLRRQSQNDSHHSSLYCCMNTSKCISKHRILDGISDCYLNDDEQAFDLSCSIDDSLRFKCSNENKCYSSLVSQDICPPRCLRHLNEIEFHHICDRTVHLFPIISDGEHHTDETECEHWPCSNHYTRCDGFWSCPHGEDEQNCTARQICPQGSLACVLPYNYTLTCLSADQVGNGIIDCLGAADEIQHCRLIMFGEPHYFGFRCASDDKCIRPTYLCDKHPDCPLKDDEEFCGDRQNICAALFESSRTDVEEALCRSAYVRNRGFSLRYAPFESRTIEQRSMGNPITSEPPDPTWPWLCNHGLYVRLWLGRNNFSYKCFCPPNYYGDICQYQKQRVSITARLRVVNSRGIYSILFTLIDDDNERREINSYQQFSSVAADPCERNFNTYLTYSTRPKNTSRKYSVHVDVFDKTSLTYIASWYFPISFPFLPVDQMAVILNVPTQRESSSSECPRTCHNGECTKYINDEKYFCLCRTGWSGVRCDIPMRCSDCSPGSICIGVLHNRSICVCPLNKGGSRCLLTLSCPEDFCENNGQCVVLDDGMNDIGYACVCPEQFYGNMCRFTKTKLEISIHNLKVSSYLLAYVLDTVKGDPVNSDLAVEVMPQKLNILQRTITMYFQSEWSVLFIEMDNNYYLAALQRFSRINISASISPTERCKSSTELLNSHILLLPHIRQVKHFHVLCRNHSDLKCFYDKLYMCLCTSEHYANCFKFNRYSSLCRDNVHCQNGAKCLQYNPTCQRETTCICIDCFVGDRCQFYAKGLGLTLDDILRYEIIPYMSMNNQSGLLKWSSAMTFIMLVGGLINSVFSVLTFRRKDSREVGCGVYLLASSITSLLTVSIFTFKFWFLVLTQINTSISRSILRGGCILLEFVLKLCLYTDTWLNACVALERSISVYKGVNFNKILSKRIARWVILILPFFITASIIHEPLYRDLFDDKEEQRLWCVFHYSQSMHNYNTFVLFFHFLGPFCANLFSALFIIFSGTRRRATAQTRRTYHQHLREQLVTNKNLILSPIILVILSVPRLVLSFLSGCVKASRDSWLYLLGYFISFIPSVTVFLVFVLPSPLYRTQFRKSVKLF